MDNKKSYSSEENKLKESTNPSNNNSLYTEGYDKETTPINKAENLAKPKSFEKKENSITKFKYWKSAIILSIIIILSIPIFLGIKNNNLIKSFSNTVYPESYVLAKDLSGLTKDTLHTTLETLIGELGNTKIKVNIGKKIFETTYKDIDVTIPYDEFEKKIFDYGKDQSFFTKVNLIKKPVKKDYEFEFSYNEEKFNVFLASIAADVNVAPVNSTINVNGGNISVTESNGGYVLNSDELLANLKLAIKDISPKAELTLDTTLLPVEESIKKETLQGVQNRISTFTTDYKSGESSVNLELATRHIDNILLMPGESFSCEQAIGPTTPENGFVLANTYSGGKVVPGYGGGVCQVSSTLYNTMLRAGIIPFERQNHMMTVSYVPIGLDSTLADGYIDLKFKNDYNYPIVINSTASNGKLTIEFWSNASVLKGLRYEPKSIQKNSLSADAYLYSYDANGTMVSEQFLDTSTYKPFPT
ncbi:VanW family protein [Clostridium gasigenes]|uniref:VanW family protein n=1 Tax=Clostridium gasigenes TaxID=94869 RepID=A0A7X0VSP7_9CLOT|nr:VanW family protein [Clostridium gasigenes]MBB6716729.1 VanW family protein [Clostridium gasigenes]